METLSGHFLPSFFAPHRVFLRKLARKLKGVISLTPTGTPRGIVLLSYVTHPFAISRIELERSPHTNPWECLEMAGVLLKEGYAVDVIDWTNARFVPKKDYIMVIDVNQNLERFASILSPSCIKVFYITGAHWRFQNEAERQRINAITKRRGVVLAPRRKMEPSLNTEYADHLIGLGNNFVHETYSFTEKKVYSLPLPELAMYESPEHKDFVAIKKNFVWIGGGGAAHKGLDLVLECFHAFPAYHLALCGPAPFEEDFAVAYRNELGGKNLKAFGRISVRDKTFKEIANTSLALVYPSASEGTPGSVVTAMHAGIIPIVSKESGIDVTPFGYVLPENTVDALRKAVEHISALPETELRARAVAAWEHARRVYTREQFRERFQVIITSILNDRTKRP